MDECIERYKPLMKGRVLDVGGKRVGKRGSFRPPMEAVQSWEYLNIDESTEPDYCCNAEEIPLPDESIDTVIMTELIEYLPDPKKVLSEIYRVTKDGCHVLISVPLLNPIHGDHWADRVRFTPVALREMAQESGFQLDTIEAMGSVGAVIYDVLRVSFGYADSDGNYTKCNKLLEKSRRFFSWFDKKTSQQKKYINTGYFMVMRKSKARIASGKHG